MTFRGTFAGWDVGVMSLDDVPARPGSSPTLVAEAVAGAPGGGTATHVEVEVWRAFGPVNGSALLDGVFLPRAGAMSVVVSTTATGEMRPTDPPIHGPLGHALQRGLPEEFAATVLRAATAAAQALAGGDLLIGAGGYHAVDSSAVAFEIASEVLVLGLPLSLPVLPWTGALGTNARASRL